MTPLEAAWDELADAELEHDQAHAIRALADLARLQQRTPACTCRGHGCSACGGER